MASSKVPGPERRANAIPPSLSLVLPSASSERIGDEFVNGVSPTSASTSPARLSVRAP